MNCATGDNTFQPLKALLQKTPACRWMPFSLCIISIALFICVAAQPSTARADVTYYAPYYKSSQGYWTGLGLTNLDLENAAAVSVIVYKEDGTPLSPAPQTAAIAAGGQSSFFVEPNGDTTGWFKITSDKELSGLCFFGLLDDPKILADIPLSSTLGRWWVVPHVAQYAQWDTELLLANPGTTQVSATITFTDGTGATVGETTLTIPALGSTAYPMSSLGTSPNGSVRISASGDITAFALYSNTKNQTTYGFAGIVPARLDSPYEASITKDIVYVSESPHERNVLDVYRPIGKPGAKVILFLPGGAWRQGDKNIYEELGRTFTEYYGYVVVIANYRLSNDEDGQAVHPDHVNDVAAAFDWTKTHIAQYGGDADKVYVFGQSAGAHLASLLTLDPKYLKDVGRSPSDIKATISMSASYNLYDLVAYPMNPLDLDADTVLMFKVMMQDAFGSWEKDVMDLASPQTYTSPTQRPMLVMYVENDLPGFAQEAQNFTAAVQALIPTPDIEMKYIKKSDISDTSWSAAAQLAAAEPTMAEYVGHYAEVATINTTDFDSQTTLWIVDFIKSH